MTRCFASISFTISCCIFSGARSPRRHKRWPQLPQRSDPNLHVHARMIPKPSHLTGRLGHLIRPSSRTFAPVDARTPHQTGHLPGQVAHPRHALAGPQWAQALTYPRPQGRGRSIIDWPRGGQGISSALGGTMPFGADPWFPLGFQPLGSGRQPQPWSRHATVCPSKCRLFVVTKVTCS